MKNTVTIIIVTLGLISYSLVYSQVETKIIGEDSLCIGQSSTYSVDVHLNANEYLFRDTTAAQSGGNGFFALKTGYNYDIISNIFSYDLWVKPTRTINMYGESSACAGNVSVPLANSNQNWAIVPSGLDGGEMSVGLTIGTNGLMVGEHSGNILVSRLSYTTPINDWVHVSIVYRTDSIFLYLNGDLVRSRQIHCASNTKRVATGLTGYYYSPDFKGNIDEFRLWDIALTRQEVKNIKDKKLVNQVQGLRYYASFDNGKFERTLGDIGTSTMTVTGLSTANHLKASTWDLEKYSGENISSLTTFNISDLNYLWSTGATTKDISYTPIDSLNYLSVITYNESFSENDTMIIIGKDCNNVALTDGLVAFYPFNGNADDESGNGNDGTVNGATLTSDRFGYSNKAYSFDGSNDFIELPNIIPVFKGSVSYWYKTSGNAEGQILVYHTNTIDNGFGTVHDAMENHTAINGDGYNVFIVDNGSGTDLTDSIVPVELNTWYHIIVTYDTQDSARMYINGNLVYTIDLSAETGTHLPTVTYVGRPSMDDRYFHGVFDDLRIYDRELNEIEIKNLFFGGNVCTETIYDTLYTTVIDTVYTTVSDTVFTTVSDTVFTTVNDTVFTTVNDTIFTTVVDTIFTTVNDTIFITVADSIAVTDTLIIDAVLTDLVPPYNANTIKVYPNPAKDHVFINTGHYSLMMGYKLKIINQLGETVFETNVEEPLYEVNLSEWTGMGLYYFQIIDWGGSIIDIRKIILQ